MTTIDLRIPIQVSYNNSKGSTNGDKNDGNDKSNCSTNSATVEMLDALKDEVTKNADCLDEVKDDIKSLGEVKDDIMALDMAVLQIQQRLDQHQVANPSCTVNVSLSKLVAICHAK